MKKALLSRCLTASFCALLPSLAQAQRTSARLPVSSEITRLSALYATMAGQIPGMHRLEVVALQPYGLGHVGFAVNVIFDEVGPARAAVLSGQLPKRLPDAKDGTPVHMSWKLPESVVAGYHRNNEARLTEELWMIPGVAGVNLEEFSAYGPMTGVTNRSFYVKFRDQPSLEKARIEGRLPRQLSALEELRSVARQYDVVAGVDATEDPKP